jgi:hypothetical protein
VFIHHMKHPFIQKQPKSYSRNANSNGSRLIQVQMMTPRGGGAGATLAPVSDHRKKINHQVYAKEILPRTQYSLFPREHETGRPKNQISLMLMQCRIYLQLVSSDTQPHLIFLNTILCILNQQVLRFNDSADGFLAWFLKLTCNQ